MSLQWLPTPEQVQLADALGRFVERDYTFEHRRNAAGAGFSARAWSILGQLGIPALLVPEKYGGLGADVRDALHVLQTLAPAMVLEPVLASSVLATQVLARNADRPAAVHWLPRLAGGEAIGTVAAFEPGGGFDFTARNTVARRAADAYVLDGRKTLVLQAAFAHVMLLSAHCDDGEPAWFAVPAETAGIALRAYPLFDGQHAADVTLHGVRVPADARLTAPGEGDDLAGDLRDLWLAATCVDAVGIAQAALGATVDYLQARRQFGQPIGRFQALQHRAVDMWIELEQMRSMAMLAAHAVAEESDRDRRGATLAACKARTSQACRFIAQQSVQLHGGLGVTDEAQISRWFKRLTLLEIWLGDADWHLQRYARRSPFCDKFLSRKDCATVQT
ncbi:MAG TPA: acyl-CoA dehydrogenase family protein [Steroidobacteraceae bacterium]|nr:acyl-CoA dehydrogenase family protein [Steroidobacteraceae bacterium]